MPFLEPFRATRYTERAGDPARLLAPPYDVIAPDEAAELRRRGRFNAVRLVLPRGEGGARYRRAAHRLERWKREGLLTREPEPALFVYRQTFAHDGARLSRTGLLGALRLEPPEKGTVLPHEETHRGPREDRAALVRACRAQLSPVFLVTQDSGDRLGELLRRARISPPELEARTPDGILHRLWRLSGDPIETEGPLLIADGHHRYETALALAGPPGEREDRGRVLACVVPASDPGLLCLATHRSLCRAPRGGEGWGAWLTSRFDGTGQGTLDPSTAARRVAETEPGSILVLLPRAGRARADRGGEGLLVRPGGEAVAEAALHGPARSAAPLLFDRLVLRPALGCGPEGALARGWLGYHRDPAEALDAASENVEETPGSGAAFLLPPLPVGRVLELAAAGIRLPPKSTYFWPKLPSGLLFRELEGPL